MLKYHLVSLFLLISLLGSGQSPVTDFRTGSDVTIEKDFIYEKYSLEDTYSYKEGNREFQWDKIRSGLSEVENMQDGVYRWAVLQNKRDVNGAAPKVQDSHIDEYGSVADRNGVRKYQSIPLYAPEDTETPEIYGQDGQLFRIISESELEEHLLIADHLGEREWIVPEKYVKELADGVVFTKVIFVDRTNQNITTLEHSDGKWLARSMNPATTGKHNPPYQQETPLGMFVVQEKKSRMVYLKDGSDETGGFAPYATRFCRGAYIHGVPVNSPGTQLIEYSKTLGTSPRSHMCVRNATSHAQFVYEWAPVLESLVYVIE